MSNEKYSPIRFSMEESIWLDHRSKTAEIISLELVPEIQLVEEREQINITGHIALRGRYEVQEEEADSLDLESSSLADQLHFQPLAVDQREIFDSKERGKIEKRIPIDVSVPLNKIEHLDDVYVNVEQFDYNIVDGQRLNIQADVVISGILKEAIAEQRQEKQEDAEQQILYPTFVVAASKDENHTQQETPSYEYSSQQEDNEEPYNNEEDIYQEVPSFRTEEQEEESAEPSFQENRYYSDAQPPSEQIPVYREQEEEDNVIPLFDHKIRTNFHSAPAEEDEQEDSATEDHESQTTSFLTQLMSNSESDGGFSSLRMCIVQKNESLEEISSRYSIPVRDIMRVNKLESEQVSAGQLIYIPKPRS